MKRFIPLLLSMMFFTIVAKAQYVTIPDPGFRNFLQQQYPSCFNSAGMMDTTCSAILDENILVVAYRPLQDTSSLNGIQYFKSLTHLTCMAGVNFDSTQKLPNSLTYLNCRMCALNRLPQLPDSLIYLDCAWNDLITLPPLPNSLTYLDCSYNQQLNLVLPDLPNLTYLNCTTIGYMDTLPSLPKLTYWNCFACNLPVLPTILPSNLKYLDCSANGITKNITALPASLTFFNCSWNYFSDIPALPPLLDSFFCGNNSGISKLPSLPNSLTVLSCTNDSITSLPTLPGTLTFLGCGNNQLSQLPILPNSLTYIECSGNKLTLLPSLPNQLVTLWCGGNQLTSLPLLPSSLIDLSCGSNKISQLPLLSKKLNNLECSFNQLTSLPALPDSLITLLCNNNQLASLPGLPGPLNMLRCNDNLLNNIPSLNPSLKDLECQNNNIYCFPILSDSLSTLYFDLNKIKCFPNNVFIGTMVGMTDSSGNEVYFPESSTQFPLCNPTNNVNHCQSFPVMDGTVFYDNNSNGIKDPTELYMPYIKMQLSNSSYTFTDNKGFYQIAAIDGTGAYTLFANPPHYYKAVPTLLNYNFTNFDTLVTKDIAMQPTAVVDSLALHIYPYNSHARPGFNFPICINYANVGTTTLSPVLTFNYDNTRLTYDSSSNSNVINTGSSLSLTETAFVPGQSNSFRAYFTTKSTDVIDDTIKTSATIVANTATGNISTATAISGSFDPNDKEATPQLTPEQVTKGKSINYTIRFQNTGNDTAFNIVIADTLSSLLQANTLQMISSSQPCKVTVTGNVVFFEFLNVLLPDNKTNDIGSNGYVSFSIQPQSSVSLGTVIKNKAAIYFDYNSPIITNTASTSIQEPNTSVPVRLISFTALTQTGTTNTLLHWSTASEINANAFVIEQSTDGINFTTVATVPAKGYGANSYSYTITDNTASYYRLKMVDNNGQYMYSKIVSINSTQKNEGITILNNPAVGFVTVKNNIALLNNTIAKIIDSHGAVVKSFVLHIGVQDIDVNNLPSGGYYIQTQINSLKLGIIR